MIRKPICWIPVAVSYAVLAWFVYFVINPLCYNIFQQPAFVLSTDFFWSKVNVPGGLSEYLQTFIDQFTMFRFWGTLFLVAEVFLTAFLTARYVRRITGDNPFVSMLVYILPVAVSVVAWSDVKYPFAINMQVLLLAAVLNLQQALSKYDWHKYVTPLLAIVIYHACGPVALYAFALCGIVVYALNPDKRELVSVVGAVAVAALWPVIVYKFILPIKPNAAFYDVRPQSLMFTAFNMSGVLFFPMIGLILSQFIGIVFEKLVPKQKAGTFAFALLALVVLCTIVLQNKHDEKVERISFKMEVAAFNRDWDWITNCMKNNSFLKEYDNYNQRINFYYNMALAEKGQMADKMFSYPQRMGINGLFINENMATVVCLPMAFFFHQAGLSTNALHYAFEAQTTYENSHYVMQYVIDELLIIGDKYTASKYLEKYGHVMFSKKYVDDRRDFIRGVWGTRFSRGGIAKIRDKHPKNDFYMRNSQLDVLQLVSSDNDNTFATQYLLASTLLQNDLDMFITLIVNGYCKVNYNSLPRAYQEAVILYRALNKDVSPEVEKLHISPYIIEQFETFKQITMKNGNTVRNLILERFPSSYWKYYFIDSPMRTGVNVSNK